MDVMFDLSMEGHWVVLYDPDLVQADVAHEALVFEDGLPPAAPDGLVFLDFGDYEGGVRLRCTTGPLTPAERALEDVTRQHQHAFHLASGTVYVEGGHATAEALGTLMDVLAHMGAPAEHPEVASAYRVRGWLAQFWLPPGRYTVTLHAICFDLDEAPSPDIPNLVLHFARQAVPLVT